MNIDTAFAATFTDIYICYAQDRMRPWVHSYTPAVLHRWASFYDAAIHGINVADAIAARDTVHPKIRHSNERIAESLRTFCRW